MMKALNQKSFLIAVGVLLVLLSVILSYKYFGGNFDLTGKKGGGNLKVESEPVQSEDVSEVDKEGEIVSKVKYSDASGFDPKSIETNLGDNGEAMVEITGDAAVELNEVLDSKGFRMLPNEEELESKTAKIVLTEKGDYIFENILKPQYYILVHVR